MKNLTLIIAIGLVVLLVSPLETRVALAHPQDTESEFKQVPAGSEGRDVPGEGPHLGWMRGKHRGWDKEKMFKLKEKDPQKFEELTCQRRAEIKERLENLKEEDPQRYKRVLQRIQQRRRMRLQALKQKDPEKFKETIEKRRAHCQQRLEKLKGEDPKNRHHEYHHGPMGHGRFGGAGGRGRR